MIFSNSDLRVNRSYVSLVIITLEKTLDTQHTANIIIMGGLLNGKPIMR
jgi:hypothetical protein